MMLGILIIMIVLLSAPLQVQAQSFFQVEADGSAVSDTLFLVEEPEAPKDRLDTIYYNRNWKVTSNKSFAEYYRLVLYPADLHLPCEFRTFYMSGEREGEGSFIELDKIDDRLSLFDGEVLRYYKSGGLAERSFYDRGELVDAHTTFFENGNVKEYAIMVNGKRDGLVKRFTEDGQICRFVPFKNGVEEGYFVMVDIDGNYSRFDLASGQPMLESVTAKDLKTEYKNGVAWPYYNKNGLIVAVSNSNVHDFGGMREIGFYVFNKSMINVELDPDKLEVYSVHKKGKRVDVEMMSAEEFDVRMQKIRLKAEKENKSQTVVEATERETNVSPHLGMKVVNAGQKGNVKAFQERMIGMRNLSSVSNGLSFDKRKIENLGYLERTTIHPGDCVAAFLLTKQKKVPELRVKLTINGIDYSYEWHMEKKK